MALFDRDSSVIIERLSDDVNREKDVFIGKPMPPADVRLVYERFEPVWLECGFVGFGMLDDDRGLETFLNDHKVVELFVPIALRESVENLLKRHRIECAESLATSFRYEHWHYPLSTVIRNAVPGCEEPFDYYDIVNDLKVPLDLELSADNDDEITVPPRWWLVTVSGAAADRREFLIDYYLVAETEEEMETFIACDLECRGIKSYRIYDLCNVNPAEIDTAVVAYRKAIDFAKAQSGIWGYTQPEFRTREKGTFPFPKKI
jgi:hypothetical protein